MTWIDRVRRFFVPPPAINQSSLHSRALAGGRVSTNAGDSFSFNTWVIAPPAEYEDNWQLINLDSRLLEGYPPTKLMELMADYSPEVSRALWDFLRFCNPGWEFVVKRPGSDVEDERGKQATQVYLDGLADRHGAVDVVLGRVLTGGFLRGALCGELVLDKRGRVPLDFATPDPASVRFRKRSDPVLGEVWQAGQWQAQRFVPLDIPTFRYVPIDPMINSPYGRPLAAPALFVTLFLLGLLHDLKRVIQQQGYQRLDISINTMQMAEKLPHLMKDTATFNKFTQELLADVRTAFANLKPDETYVHSDMMTMNRPVGTADASSLGGINAIISMLERMAVRALKTNSLMFDLGESRSETEANRKYEIFVAGIKSIQHYAETMFSRLLTLALEAQGIQAVVEFRFAELRASEMMRDAQVEMLRIGNAKEKRNQGWITQDESSEEITGSPAVGPAPAIVQTPLEEPPQGDNDGGEALNQDSDDRSQMIAEIRAARQRVEATLAAISTNGYHAH